MNQELAQKDYEIERLRATLRQAEALFGRIASTKTDVTTSGCVVLDPHGVISVASTGESLCRDTLLPVKK